MNFTLEFERRSIFYFVILTFAALKLKTRKMKKHLLTLLLALGSVVLFAQTTVSGKIVDAETGEALIGATVLEKGTNNGVITDVQGAFTLKVKSESTIAISYVGYLTQEFASSANFSSISLESDAVGLAEVQVIASVAIDRKTPIAVSTVRRKEIEAKIGSQEFPEILKSTPGVFATKSGGGFGDGRINVRGFNDENVAVLINGIPVNDMENGNVYWSNWAGLTDAASNIQVQRGLGASKVAVPSVGGTINILSKASDREEGGEVKLSTGNDAYSKVGFSLSSGLNDEGWAFTVSGAKTQGNMYLDGGQFLGFSYFVNVAKKINDAHELNFTLVGAKQTHGQRFHDSSLEVIKNNPRGRRYNPDWGYQDGQEVNLAYNFYHKPQMSLNHYWEISDKAMLSTAAYASFGQGGGRRTQGTINDFNNLVRTGGEFGPVDVDHYVQQNESNQSGESTAWLAASVNSHNWYGVLSTLDYDISSNLKFLGGLDLRSYTGIHYYEVTDLLGGSYITDDSRNNVINPNSTLRVGDRYNRDYEGNVLWSGLFGQLEYTQDQLSAFVSFSGSNTRYSKVDFYSYAANDPDRESEKLDFLGYQVKGGANYNLNQNHNVYANIGFFTKAPQFDNVFAEGDNSTSVNEGAEHEKIFSTELGYGYRKYGLTANVNIYRTQWNDRALQQRETAPSGEVFFANVLGVNALHQGVEFDAKYDLNRKLQFTGMLSLGDWTWTNNVQDVIIRDQDGNQLGDPINVYIEGLKVGNAAQTTAALGFNYELLEDLKVGMDWNYYDNLFASYNPTGRNNVGDNNIQAWQIPSYSLLDLNISYDFEISGLTSSIYGNINNIADTFYVADARDGGNALNSSMYAGFGRTWTLGAVIRF